MVISKFWPPESDAFHLKVKGSLTIYVDFFLKIEDDSKKKKKKKEKENKKEKEKEERKKKK